MENHWLYRDHDYAGDRARFPALVGLRRTGTFIKLVHSRPTDAWLVDVRSGWIVPWDPFTAGVLVSRYKVTAVFSERLN